MAVAIPLISLASGVTAAAGAIAAGSAIGIGTFLTMAGGLLGTIGVLEKKSDLMKLGGVLALGGFAANAIGSAGNAAGTSTATATGDAVDTAKLMTQGAEGGESLLTAPGAAQPQQMPSLLEQAKLSQAGDAGGLSNMTGIDGAGNVVAPMGGGMGGSAPSIADALTGQSGALTGGAMPASAAPDFLSEAARSMTGSEVAGAIKNTQQMAGSLWDRATGAMGKGMDWIKANPMPTALIAQGISGTMAARQQQEALDYQRSLIERARANMNSPVRMQFTPGG